MACASRYEKRSAADFNGRNEPDFVNNTIRSKLNPITHWNVAGTRTPAQVISKNVACVEGTTSRLEELNYPSRRDLWLGGI